jgi:hypothetical protein
MTDIEDTRTQVELIAELQAAYREISRQQDALHTAWQKEREAYREEAAQARREAWRTITFNPQLYVMSHVETQFKAVMDATMNHRCGKGANGTGMGEIHAAMRDFWERYWSVEDSADVSAAVEIKRLRTYMQEVGSQLHADTAAEAYGNGCPCVGCELIRGIDADNV